MLLFDLNPVQSIIRQLVSEQKCLLREAHRNYDQISSRTTSDDLEAMLESLDISKVLKKFFKKMSFESCTNLVSDKSRSRAKLPV